MLPWLAARLSRRVGGVPLALGFVLPAVGIEGGWSARGEGLQAADADGDVACPGPAGGQAEPEPAAAADDPPRH